MSEKKNIFCVVQDALNSLTEKRFILFTLSAYFFVILVTALHHEMWFDEIQAWLIARDSNNLNSLLENLRYEGHPPLWHISLFLISRVTQNMISMQILHVLLSTSAVYVILRYSLFSRAQKLLIVFGYFFLYEYAALSRNYAYGILFIFLFCAYFRPGIGKNYIILAVILFFLSITNAYGFLIVFILTCTLIFECLIDKELRKNISGRKIQLFIALAIILLGLGFSAIVMSPAEDNGTTAGVTKLFDLTRLKIVLSSVWKSYIPIPRLGRDSFWNSNIFPGKSFPSIIAIPLLVYFLFAFSRKIIIFFLFSFSTLTFLAFQYLIYPGALRHSGHFFILLIVCYWLSMYYENDNRLEKYLNLKLVDYCDSHKTGFINIILCIHFFVGIYACGMEYKNPFTIAPKVAKYLLENNLDEMPILACDDLRGLMVGIYLKQTLYYPQGDRCGTFLLLDKKRTEKINEEQLIQKAEEFSREKDSDILLVLTEELKNTNDSIFALHEFHFESILSKENYYVYTMKARDDDTNNSYIAGQ